MAARIDNPPLTPEQMGLCELRLPSGEKIDAIRVVIEHQIFGYQKAFVTRVTPKWVFTYANETAENRYRRGDGLPPAPYRQHCWTYWKLTDESLAAIEAVCAKFRMFTVGPNTEGWSGGWKPRRKK